MLCNIAAAEFVMPIGSLALNQAPQSIEQLMEERRKYDVSAEAFMIRLARSSEAAIGIFCASPFKGKEGWTYRVDYFIGSPSSPKLFLTGKVLPKTSAIHRCTAIGFTDRADESWITGSPLPIEYVGIPGYPGVSLPRAIGLIRFGEPALGHRPLRYVHGNALEPRGTGPRIICQLVNDRALRWGGGIAQQTAKKFPLAQADFSSWLANIPFQERLGNVHFYKVDEDVTIASIVGQSGFGSSNQPRIRYVALEAALSKVAEQADKTASTVHLPRIGTGAAGGKWQTVVEMVEEAFTERGIDVLVYDLPPRRKQLNLF